MSTLNQHQHQQQQHVGRAIEPEWQSIRPLIEKSCVVAMQSEDVELAQIAVDKLEEKKTTNSNSLSNRLSVHSTILSSPWLHARVDVSM